MKVQHDIAAGVTIYSKTRKKNIGNSLSGKYFLLNGIIQFKQNLVNCLFNFPIVFISFKLNLFVPSKKYLQYKKNSWMLSDQFSLSKYHLFGMFCVDLSRKKHCRKKIQRSFNSEILCIWLVKLVQEIPYR